MLRGLVFRTHLSDDAFEIKVAEVRRASELIPLIDEGKYDIVHFYGHGEFDVATDTGYILFQRPEGSFRLSGEQLGGVLAGRGIRLVFLNMCETARSGKSSDPTNSSVAGALLEHGISAVIGPQFSMPVTSAPFLSAMIYNSLATGKTLVEAMRRGRQALLMEGDSPKFYDWGIPVLYASDPDLILFPQPTNQPWAEGFEALFQADPKVEEPHLLKGLMRQGRLGGPSVSVESTARANPQAAKERVALVDIDSKVGFLPDLVNQANSAQDYYHFQVVYLPIPSGAAKIHSPDAEPQTSLPRLEKYLSDKPKQLGVDRICCLTRLMIAVDEESEEWNYIAASLYNNPSVLVLSTYQLRSWAKSAKVAFAKAVLYCCLSVILLYDERWDLTCHDKTVGCMFDYCENRDDTIVGLRRMAFDHQACRRKVKDKNQLQAIDALLALRDHSGKASLQMKKGVIADSE